MHSFKHILLLYLSRSVICGIRAMRPNAALYTAKVVSRFVEKFVEFLEHCFQKKSRKYCSPYIFIASTNRSIPRKSALNFYRMINDFNTKQSIKFWRLVSWKFHRRFLQVSMRTLIKVLFLQVIKKARLSHEIHLWWLLLNQKKTPAPMPFWENNRCKYTDTKNSGYSRDSCTHGRRSYKDTKP